MNGNVLHWMRLRRESRARDWSVRLRMAESRLLRELRALHGA